MSAPSHTDFTKRFPGYESTSIIDDLRKTQYPLLEKESHIYLDYGGLSGQRGGQQGAEKDTEGATNKLAGHKELGCWKPAGLPGLDEHLRF